MVWKSIWVSWNVIQFAAIYAFITTHATSHESVWHYRNSIGLGEIGLLIQVFICPALSTLFSPSFIWPFTHDQICYFPTAITLFLQDFLLDNSFNSPSFHFLCFNFFFISFKVIFFLKGRCQLVTGNYRVFLGGLEKYYWCLRSWFQWNLSRGNSTWLSIFFTCICPQQALSLLWIYL